MMYQILTFFATPVLADDYGLEATAGAAELAKFGKDLPVLIGNVLGTALSLVGVLFFALMLYGGITWMMAHGNAESEKKALSTITAAIIGILIVLGSYALTSFVLSSVKGAGTGTVVNDNTKPTDTKKFCKCDDLWLNDISDQLLCEFLAAFDPTTVVETYQSCSWNNGPTCMCVVKDKPELEQKEIDFKETDVRYKTKSICDFLPNINKDFTNYTKCEWIAK